MPFYDTDRPPLLEIAPQTARSLRPPIPPGHRQKKKLNSEFTIYKKY